MLQPKQSPKEKKNTKDATQMKNMKPVFKGPNSKLPMPKNLTGKARNGKPVKKAFLGSLLGGAGKSMLGGLASQAVSGIASQALGGLMGGGGKSGGGASAQGGQGQAPMPRKSTDMTPVKTRGMMKKGGKVTKAKNGKSFPDLNKDGKITKADILKGRGVIAKKGMSVKKAQNGAKTKAKPLPTPRIRQIADSLDYEGNMKAQAAQNRTIGTYVKDYKDAKGYDKIAQELNQSSIKDRSNSTRYRKLADAAEKKLKSKKKAKTGASVKKCKYGCK